MSVRRSISKLLLRKNVQKHRLFRFLNFFGINFEINQRTTAVVIKYAQIQKDPIIADVELGIISTMMIIHVLMLTSATVTATIRN